MWSSWANMAIGGPAHQLQRQIREKTPKWPGNDQFRQFHFLIKRFYGPNYSPFDAELRIGFFEITYRFVGCLVLELLTKNVAKNRSTKFRQSEGHGSRKVRFRWRLGIRPNLVEMFPALGWVYWTSFICVRAIHFKINNNENQRQLALQRWFTYWLQWSYFPIDNKL